MGIVLENIKYKNVLNDISYRFSKRRITGIYGDNANYILDIINGDILDYSGLYVLEKIEMDLSFFQNNPAAITLIDSNPFFFTTKVMDEFKFNVELRKYKCDDLNKRIDECLNYVGLDDKILDRVITTLSTSEKYLLSIAINLMFDPDVILFKDIFVGMDHNTKKKISILINNLKEEKKLIIVTTKDINDLYEITDEVILLNGPNIYKSGISDKIFTSIDIIKDDVIPMPSITKVTYYAKTDKKVKLSFHKDVRDIIKDIYKHV